MKVDTGITWDLGKAGAEAHELEALGYRWALARRKKAEKKKDEKKDEKKALRSNLAKKF